ncbi:hypothetical protein PGTUg99_032107 [Puccinia graminis f. sp. tritici]|uniref:Uncharacterized protein n=1 Tax=Puccinia graminis f. sp. tritici TaxID=56615 RepID=A0A5B0RMT8_PUCGR|nr:hypothetical protein PGTUg99_032107 [Puccinia graminis f. sp. tritici]
MINRRHSKITVEYHTQEARNDRSVNSTGAVIVLRLSSHFNQSINPLNPNSHPPTNKPRNP